MIEITLPDGSIREFDNPVTVMDVAKSIGSGLAKATLAGEVDGKLVDASHEINTNASLSIVTDKDEKGLEIIRHSTAHLMAQATQMLYPEAQVTIGPVIDDGFYYDFSYKDGFTESDLEKIEKNMSKLVSQNLAVKRFELSRDEAVDFFKNKGEFYKAEIIESIPQDEILSLYEQGDFVDLCRGPHVPSTGKLKAFKLMKLAGAYWRGDSNNEMLQRVYGTAWSNKQDLEEYIHRLEEAEKRDHRKLGNEMNLFTTAEELGSGNFLWKPKGAVLRDLIETYSKNAHLNNGYQLVNTPHIGKSVLWETSGHLQHYKENMFPPLVHQENDETYYLKPMNCPFHILVYKSDIHSYRELPIRLFEFGSVYRYEKTGVLHGMLRLRGFTQDDAHIFCSIEQINEEVKTLLNFSIKLLNSFGLHEIEADLSTRPEKSIGSDEDWDIATDSLKKSLNDLEVPYITADGEGAFYGPKIDLHAKDAIGRRWQLSTIQVDFAQPDNFDIQYVNKNNEKVRPVMLHRALLGSIERFTGVLLEHYAGELPGWLAPVQIDICTIGDVDEYVDEVKSSLDKYRINIDNRNVRLGEKLHNSEKLRTPIQMIIGENDKENSTVALNFKNLDNEKDLSLKDAIQKIADYLKEPEFNLHG